MSKGLMDYLFVCSLSALGGMFYLINHPMQNLIVNNIFLGAFLAFSSINSFLFFTVRPRI
jgi:hypothetical protein